MLKLAAPHLRRRLKQKGLESVLKCTGDKGLHVTVPLAVKDMKNVLNRLKKYKPLAEPKTQTLPS